MRKRKKGFTLIELMIVIAIIAIIAAIAIPGILSAIRSGNERNASGSLKAVPNADHTFRQNFAFLLAKPMHGLYLARAPNATDVGKYIDESLAKADQDLAASKIAGTSDDLDADGNNDITFDGTVKLGAVVLPKSGYTYVSIDNWYDVPTKAYVASSKISGFVVGAGSGAIYNNSRFSYQALPASYGTSGRLKFFIDEGATVYQKDDGNNTVLVNCPHQAAAGVDALSTWKQTGN